MNSCISRLSARLSLSKSTRLLLSEKNCLKTACGKQVVSRNPTKPTGLLNIIRSICVTSSCHVSFVYSVSLKTGNMVGAGTDTLVYIRMIGENGSTDEVLLPTESTHLERGCLDHYTVSSDDVGPLKKMIIRHDSTGFAAGWFLEWIKIRDGRGSKYHFDCNDWLAKDEDSDSIKLLKERNYHESEDITAAVSDARTSDDGEEDHASCIENHAHASELDKSIFKDLKVLEELSAQIKTPKAETEASSGTDSQLAEGDLLALMSKEKIRMKIFTVKSSGAKGAATASSFDIPHLYMVTRCDVCVLDSFIKNFDQKLQCGDTRNSVLAKMFSSSLINAGFASNNEAFDVIVSHNGNSIVLKDCGHVGLENMVHQFKNFEVSEDMMRIPKYGLNIITHFYPTQLSSVLQAGQVVSVSVTGPKMEIENEQVHEYLNLSVSCDVRIVSEIKGAMILLNLKKYISNPSLLNL